MVKNVWFVIFLGFLLFNSGLAQLRYSHPTRRFSVTVPQGWALVTDRAVLEERKALLLMNRGGVEILVTESTRSSLEELVAVFDGAIKNLGPKTLEKTLTVNEIPCHIWIRESKGGEALMCAALVSGNRGFMVVGLAQPQRETKAVKDYFEVLKSFRVEGGFQRPERPYPSHSPRPTPSPNEDDF